MAFSSLFGETTLRKPHAKVISESKDVIFEGALMAFAQPPFILGTLTCHLSRKSLQEL
jgi:hypothetical protein